MPGVVGDGGKHPLGDGLAASLRSRPLKPGKSFTLVVSAARVHHLGWDRADYAPGDACRLKLAGKKLGKAPLTVTVEAEVDGAWVEVEKVQAKVDPDQAQAVVDWKFPVPKGHAEAVAAREERRRGKLLSASWTRPEVPEGDALAAEVAAEGMEGATLVFLIEREFPDGSWRGASHTEGKVAEGRCEVSWAPPAEAAAGQGGGAARGAAKGALVACRFEDGLELGAADTAWLKANCPGLEGQTVELVLEREEAGGWAEVSNAVSTVKAGEARTGLLLRK